MRRGGILHADPFPHNVLHTKACVSLLHFRTSIGKAEESAPGNT